MVSIFFNMFEAFKYFRIKLRKDITDLFLVCLMSINHLLGCSGDRGDAEVQSR